MPAITSTNTDSPYSEVRLTVTPAGAGSAAQGLVIDAYDEYTIHLSMEKSGSPWTFTCWHSTVASSTWDVLLNQVKIGDLVTFTLDGVAQLQGRIETRHVSVRESGAVLSLSGRDMAGPAMSWDADPTISYKGVDLLTALTRLFEPLRLNVVCASSAAATVRVGPLRRPRGSLWNPARRTSKIDVVHPSPGQKTWAVADMMVRKAGYMIWTAPATTAVARSASGGSGLVLVVDVPNNGGTSQWELTRKLSSDGLVVTSTSNILDADYTTSILSVPTITYVYANAPRGDNEAARLERAFTNERLFDARVTAGLLAEFLYPQPLHIVSTRARTQDQARREAERYVAEQMRHFRIYRCTVRGHFQTVYGERVIYALNHIAHVKDDVAGVDGDWLVTEIEFHGSRARGQTTTLTMLPRGAMVCTPDTVDT